MPDFTCLDENLFAKVAETLLQHISSTHCNFKSALGPSILLLCVRLADVQMNGFINYCGVKIVQCFSISSRELHSARAAVGDMASKSGGARDRSIFGNHFARLFRCKITPPWSCVSKSCPAIDTQAL